MIALILGIGAGYFVFKTDCPKIPACNCPEVKECKIYIDTCMIDFPPVINPTPANSGGNMIPTEYQAPEESEGITEFTNTITSVGPAADSWGDWWQDDLKAIDNSTLEEMNKVLDSIGVFFQDSSELTEASDPLCEYNIYHIESENETAIIKSTIETAGTLLSWTPSMQLKEPQLVSQRTETVTIEQAPPDKNILTITGGYQLDPTTTQARPVIGAGYGRQYFQANYKYLPATSTETKRHQFDAGVKVSF